MEYKIQVGFEFGPMTVVGATSGNSLNRAWVVRCECGKEYNPKRRNFNQWRHHMTCSCGAKPTFKPTKLVPSPYGLVGTW